MKITKRFLIIACMLSFLFSAYGQSDVNIPNVVPPSPNIRNILKYGEFPVSNYIGVPEISIPIYAINLKDINIPINISYNASGIRVEEEAGRVGLGWTLNAGGIISHTVMGRFNDFYENAYFSSPSDNNLRDLTQIYHSDKYTVSDYNTPLPFTLYNMSKFDFYCGLSGDNIDCGGTEFVPDIFNYNFMGYSGTFIFSRTGQIIKEKEDNLIITPIINKQIIGPKKLESWVIITPDGMKFYFEEAEQAQISSFISGPQIYNSSFYLTQIESVNGTYVYFYYKKKSQTSNLYNRVQDSSLNLDVSFSNTFYEIVYLDKIVYPGGAVRFDYLFDRQDNAPEPKLSTISIDENGTNKMKWQFNYDYFQANSFEKNVPTLDRIKSIIGNNTNYYNDSWNKYRLKLKDIELSNNDHVYSYKFSYNESRLPTKLSASVDHWGYYNGANNSSLVPYFTQNISQESDKIEIGEGGLGANREVTEGCNQAFILNEITYPTGGKTKFIYETNKFKTDIMENDPHKRDFLYSKEVVKLKEEYYWNNVPTDYMHTVPLHIPYTGEGIGYETYINVRIKIVLNDSYKTSTELESALYMSIENSQQKPWFFTYQAPYLPLQSEINDNNKTYERTWDYVKIYTGDYNLNVYGSLRKYLYSTVLEVDRIIFPKESITNKPVGLGGGLRIKEVISCNADGKKVSKKIYQYTYDGSLSELNTSGKLMFYPRYQENFNTVGSNGLRGNGYSVGYSQVHVSDIDSVGVELGKIVYDYVNIPDKNLYYTWDEKDDYINRPLGQTQTRRAKDENPHGLSGYKFSENGTLLKESVYKKENGTDKKIKETGFMYDFVGGGPNIVWGVLKSSFNVKSDVQGSSCFKDLDPVFVSQIPQTVRPSGYLYPAIRPMWIRNKQKEEIFFDTELPLKVATDYDYNSKYRYVTKEEIYSSENKLRTVEYKYPFDIIGKSAIDNLVANNRINSPIEITKKVEDKVISQITKDYTFFKSMPNVPQLSEVKSNTGVGRALESRVIYREYDNKGNPVLISKDSISVIIYLWSYHGQYPIAKIQNATYSEVETALIKLGVNIKSLSESASPDMNTINLLRIGLPNAHVFTYTYQPLVGLLTVTSPNGIVTYYNYDDLGRLKETYNIIGGLKKVIQSYDYHYKN